MFGAKLTFNAAASAIYRHLAMDRNVRKCENTTTLSWNVGQQLDDPCNDDSFTGFKIPGSRFYEVGVPFTPVIKTVLYQYVVSIQPAIFNWLIIITGFDEPLSHCCSRILLLMAPQRQISLWRFSISSSDPTVAWGNSQFTEFAFITEKLC